MDQHAAVGLVAAAVLGTALGVAASVGGWIGPAPASVALPEPGASATGDAPGMPGVGASELPTGDVSLTASASPGTIVASAPARSTTRSTTSPTGAPPTPSGSVIGAPPSASRTTSPVAQPGAPSTGLTLYPTTPAGTPTPSMALVLYRTSVDGAAHLVLGARVSAFLPVLDGGDTLLSRTVSYGDGGRSSTASTQRCAGGASAREVDGTWAYEHTYTKAGSYTVTFTAVACPPVGTRTTTLDVTVV